MTFGPSSAELLRRGARFLVRPGAPPALARAAAQSRFRSCPAATPSKPWRWRTSSFPGAELLFPPTPPAARGSSPTLAAPLRIPSATGDRMRGEGPRLLKPPRTPLRRGLVDLPKAALAAGDCKAQTLAPQRRPSVSSGRRRLGRCAGRWGSKTLF